MNAEEFVDLARSSQPNLPSTEILRFIETDEEFRFAVCEELNKTVTASDRELVRYITKLNIESFNDSWDSLDPFRLCGLLLYKIGNVEDSVLLWKVKELNFDTAAGLEIQMLTGAGVDETISYLKSFGDESKLKAAKLLEANRDNFPKDFVKIWETYFCFEQAD